MNFILSNGAKTEQRDEDVPTDFTHMIPAGLPNMIRSVHIHHSGCIIGFSFLDKKGALLWKIGWTDSWLDLETVKLKENERIVGVVAKLRPGCQTVYRDLQFKIATKRYWRKKMF